MMNVIVTRIAGFPIGFEGVDSRRHLKTLLGGLQLPPTKLKPILTVQLVRNLSRFRALGFTRESTERILGAGFALDLKSKTLFYPSTAKPEFKVKNGTKHNSLVRTIVFALGLIVEVTGLESLGSTKIPIYLHSSSIISRKGALIFCGESTFGKTTISRKLLKKFEQVDDDQSFLILNRSCKERPRLLTCTQKAGKLNLRSVPTAGIFWLSKSPQFAIADISTAEAVSLLLSPMVYVSERAAISNRIKLLRAMLSTIACRKLDFRKDSDGLVKFLKHSKYL